MLVDGEVRTNGQALGSGIKTVSAYVQETDVFIGNLKVMNHIYLLSNIYSKQFSMYTLDYDTAEKYTSFISFSASVFCISATWLLSIIIDF